MAPEPGCLVEAALLLTRTAHGGDGFDHASLRRGAAQRELEQDVLTELEAPETRDLRGNPDLEARPPRRGRHREHAPLRGIDERSERASVERVEPRTPPPPAEHGEPDRE